MNPLYTNPLYELYAEASGGHPDALVFLWSFHYYIHEIDDLVDGQKEFNAENLVGLLVKANTLYSTPFWIGNSAALSSIMVHIAATWLDSVAWEKDPVLWKRNVADVIRLCGNDMVRTVAHITGSFESVRRISLRLREFSWQDQHEREVQQVKVA
jgi:hypothetical protein